MTADIITPAPASVTLAGWAASLPAPSIGGSLYAVPGVHRVQAATVLTDAEHVVHADLILGDGGEHIGVTPAEVAAVRAAQPGARLDLHLITLASPEPSVIAAEAAVLTLAETLGAERISVSAAVLGRHEFALELLRAKGVQIWREVAPSDTADSPLEDTVDGALIMLIEPGTTHSADPAHLAKISRLKHGGGSYGVDGGVNAELASASLAAGADYIVSGRALLSAGTSPTTQTTSQIPVKGTAS